MNFILIGAEWCPHCVELKPEILEYFSKNLERLNYIEVVKENRQEIKDKYQIKCIPALIVIDDDNEFQGTWHADMQESVWDFINKYN